MQWFGLPRVLRLEYCFKRGIYYAIENPVSSLIWVYHPLEVPSGVCLGYFWIDICLQIYQPCDISLCRQCWDAMVQWQFQSLLGSMELCLSNLFAIALETTRGDWHSYTSILQLFRKRVTIYTTAPYLQQIGRKLDPVRRPPMCCWFVFHVPHFQFDDRERLARLKSGLNLEVVRKFICHKTGIVKVVTCQSLDVFSYNISCYIDIAQQYAFISLRLGERTSTRHLNTQLGLGWRPEHDQPPETKKNDPMYMHA